MTPTINADRLWQSIMDIAEIGPTPEGGSCRLALTPEDAAARALFLQWCQRAGAASSSRMRSATCSCGATGSEPAAGAVAFGSHLDTVPTGGRFDGVVRRAGRAGGDARAGRGRACAPGRRWNW